MTNRAQVPTGNPHVTSDEEAMRISKAIGEAMHAALESAGWGLGGWKRLSREAGVGESTLTSWGRGMRRAPLEGLFAVERVLNLPMGWILRRAGFVVDAEDMTLNEAVMSYEKLTLEQRAAVCTIIEGMVDGRS